MTSKVCTFRLTFEQRNTKFVINSLTKMKKVIFRILATLNRFILPRYSKRDLSKLSKFDQALIAYRYWVTKNAV